jgi:hypothetical protein
MAGGHITYKLPISHARVALASAARRLRTFSGGAAREAKLVPLDSGDLLLRFDGAGLDTGNAVPATRKAAEAVMDWLTLYGVDYRAPEVHEVELPEPPSAGVTAVLWSVWGDTEPITPVELSQEDIDLLDRSMATRVDQPVVDVTFHLYRQAISSKDSLAEFILHYYNLLILSRDPEAHTESQAYVDKLICEINPAEPMVPHPNRNKPETRFTKLRNDIGHPERREVDPFTAQLTEDVRVAVYPLRDIVREAIKRKLKSGSVG